MKETIHNMPLMNDPSIGNPDWKNKYNGGKIAFFSQMGFRGKIPRNHPNMRTEFAQMCALDAYHYNLFDIMSITEHYDHTVLLIPKTPEDRKRLYSINLIKHAKRFSDKVWFMQEGPSWVFQDMPIHHQFWHYNNLIDVDGILTENETDIDYFSGLVGHEKPIHDIPSLMITDDIVQRSEWGDAVIMGGNFVRWYGGFDSYVVARIFQPEHSIHCVSMGRKQNKEDDIEDIKYLPYMQWREWIDALSQFDIGVHLMPTIAAGTFAMNCGFHGIPCIGYDEADTQRKIHPKLSVKMGNVGRARKLAISLKNDTIFKRDCEQQARENWENEFSEKVFCEKMSKVLS